MATDKLIRMATQMADFFRNQPDQPAAEGVAQHINLYWNFAMRRSLIDQIRAGAEADPIVRDCIAFIQLPANLDRAG
ncbi:formate dehydrogenase subunit delta [Paracoccus sp. (in: a-proteobacteria)]|uniref:formate dehydrogenase subunit delta n=1 Tax=Paracoccus sp. TaxID=267 RepID=UPI00289FB7DC|nr:formate dehydrogenase subunit delta [Paracoccus sp. (in: a-proteobacteria)]